MEVEEADHQDMNRKEVCLAVLVVLLNDLVNDRLMTLEVLVEPSFPNFRSLVLLYLPKGLYTVPLGFGSWDMGWEEEPAWVVEEEVAVEQLERRLLSHCEGESRPSCHPSLTWLVRNETLTCAGGKEEV